MRWITLFLATAVGCSNRSSSAPSPASTASATLVNMQFDPSAGWLSAPFPSDHLVGGDGSIDLHAFPNPNKIAVVENARVLVAAQAKGFSLTGGVFFSLDSPLDPSTLPDLRSSVLAGSNVFLMGVDDRAPDFLERYPVDVTFVADGGPFGTPNLLAIVPLQGIPLRPATLYTAVILKNLGDARGVALGVPPALSEMSAGRPPEGLSDRAYASYARALDALERAGIDKDTIAGIAAFTTDAPAAGLALVKSDLLARAAPSVDAPFRLTDVFDGYCVYQTTIGMPEYQRGVPPYSVDGGDWVFDTTGHPIVQRTETARIVATIPRTVVPLGGFPVAVFIRTGGGGDRPLVDRGRDAVAGGPAVTPGSGPALYFARAGYAGLSVDGPLGGLRNPTGGNEDFLIFNVFNLAALRDNLRQSAGELALLAHVLPSLVVASDDCPGVENGPVRFDVSTAVLMGHSMGATIAPLVLANEPIFGAAVLSGAGASWMSNLLYKQLPLDLHSLVDASLGYPSIGRTVGEADPVLSLIQWAIEPADPLVYARSIVREPATAERPRHVLMEQGIVDHYIMPPIANALSLSLGLDLAGVELDSEAPELGSLTPLSALLPFSGRTTLALPLLRLSGDGARSPTAVVVQHPGDGIEDGHEAVFQTDPPKHEYECFLQSFLSGPPIVVAGGNPEDGCP